MATITLIGQGSSVVNNALVQATLSAAVASGDTLICAVGCNQSARTWSFDDPSANNFLLAGANTSKASTVLGYVLSSQALSLGAVITATASGAATSKGLSVWKISPGSSALSDSQGATGDGNALSVSTTGSSSAGDFVFAIGVSDDPHVLSQPGGIWIPDWTVTIGSDVQYAIAHGVAVASVSTYAPTASPGFSKNWGASIAAFTISGGGGGSTGGDGVLLM